MHNRNSITLEKAEDLKKEHCYVAADYCSELKLFQVKGIHLLSPEFTGVDFSAELYFHKFGFPYKMVNPSHPLNL